MTDLARAAADLRSRHRSDAPLVLPNAWDPPSAQLVEQAGFPVVATSSAAMLATIGHHDGGSAPPDAVFAAIARIAAAVTIPVTADIEDGYGLAPAELAERLLAAGAVGCNLEDSDHRHPGQLLDPGAQAARIADLRAAGRAAGVDLVLNARVDTFVHPGSSPDRQLDEACRRAARYLDAGADCVYPILLPDAGIATFVSRCAGAVNVLAPADPHTIARFATLGVARISTGPRLAQAAQQFLTRLLAEIAASASLEG